MKAIALMRYLPAEDPESLIDIELDIPEAQGRDLLVRVEAVSVNPVDTKIRSPKPEVEDAPKVLGWDACGIVVATGSEVSLIKEGDRVYYAGDITRPGCNAEFHLVDERIVSIAPESLSDAEAAALPLTTLTAWESLFERMHINLDGDNSQSTLLVIGGAGGVGSMAIQLASKIAGLRVIATASRPESTAWCEKMGADEVVNHHRDIASQLSELGLSDVDYILCCNDTDMHFDTMVEVIRPQGAICCIVDSKAELPMNKLKAKSVRFSWEFMFTRAKFQTADMVEQHHILSEVSRLVDEGTLSGTANQQRSPINAENLRAVHMEIEEGRTLGKIVLSGW
ncbi:MAG: zinc-binding alcohol dehydrogenase family protein [Oleiphilus sp.]|nr:MAG: zinc-binding alcohol dehydrogenase family protein [Oleiphilus sp.]